MLKAGIIGATGYAGEELIKILLRHPKIKLSYLAAQVNKSQEISDIFPEFKGKIDLECDNLNLGKTLECDILFLALPHTASMQIVPKILSSKRLVIDLSADYRLKNPQIYETWYKCKHTDILNLKKAVYGLPEIYRDKIKKARFVANPGCYPTAAILAVTPILKQKIAGPDIIIDAKSGYSGAGRKSQDDPFYEEIRDNLKSYKVNQHQHMPEITQEFSKIAKRDMHIDFVPHILSIKRGILETIYIKKNKKSKIKNKNLVKLYKEFYREEPFVRVKDEGNFPSIQDVAGTNFCDIAVKDNGDRVVILCAIDNLLKGASGQAVQNLNIMLGLDEKTGLI